MKVADVADQAGVTKGAVYHVWPSQEAYRKDLLQRLLDQSRQAGIRELHQLLSDPDVLNADPRSIMHRYADFVFDALKEDPAFFARFSFFVYAANPEVSALLASGDDAVIEDFGPVVEQYLELIGRRVRAPFTTELMLISINSLFQGLCLRHRTLAGPGGPAHRPGGTRRVRARARVHRHALQRARRRPRLTDDRSGLRQVGSIRSGGTPGSGVARHGRRCNASSASRSAVSVPGR